MTQDNASVDERQQAELRLTTHLFECIKGDLTGSALPELGSAAVPRERLHAGVLLPDATTLPTTVVTSGDGLFSEHSRPGGPLVPTESTMSMDFEVRLPADHEDFLLRLVPRVSIYYAIFPTWEEVTADLTFDSSAGIAQAVEEDGATPTNEVDIEVDPEDQESMPDLSLPQQIAEEIKATAPQSGDTIILPRRFRRHTANLTPIEVPVDRERLAGPGIEVRSPIQNALAAVRERCAQDPRVWRHLGTPEVGKREVTLGQKPDAASYVRTLEVVQGEPALPHWRAHMTITGSEPLLSSAGDERRVLRINVALINTTPAIPFQDRARAQLEECALFNCGFAVEVEDATMVPFQFHGTPKDYRHERSFEAMGSNCIVIAEPNQSRLTTEAVPLFAQPWYRTRDDLTIAFADLDDRPGTDVFTVLNGVEGQMGDYLARWDEYLGSRDFTAAEEAACRADRDRFVREVGRYRLGVGMMHRDRRLLRAFRLMNRVFGTVGAQRLPPMRTWRLFQLVFMVIQLPSLAVRERTGAAELEEDRALEESLRRADVLWFPTGGGKTEAYLGLITTALFFDRLRGKSRGVTAWMRFPLRMLSLQQLERLAAVLAVAEQIRASEPDLHGGASDPFGIGYYVGGNNTPNRIREGDVPGAEWARYQVFRHCPFCGGDVSISFQQDTWRLAHICANPRCYTNISKVLGEVRGTLPLYLVDNEIYRYRPSVLVGTVDKLAVLGFQRHFAHLTSSVTEKCPIHGYASFGVCVESASGGPCKQTKSTFAKLTPERDPMPALLIQDELHLLKEELGTFNSHYEGFLRYLPERQGHRPPKVLAATATIEAYEEQTFHLYLEKANRFPEPSWQDGESFYATSTPHVPRRLYSGILTHQRSPEAVALRALQVYQERIHTLRDNVAALRDVTGLTTWTDEELASFLRLYDLSVAYVNRKATGGNLDYHLSQQDGADLSSTLLTGDDTMVRVGEVIEQIERERETGAARHGERRLEVLIATSLISHGVDLERINFLCMTGMPSRYAEYIQATSRAARAHVGLVLVCFKRSDLRERSQYHYFLPNHRFLNHLVEPVPINRFSSYAPRRTAPGLVAGMLMSHYSRELYAEKAIKRPLDNMRELKKAIEGGHITRDQLEADLCAIIGTHHPEIDPLQRRYVKQGISEAMEEVWDHIHRSLETTLYVALKPISSFRDVDAALDFVGDGSAAAFVTRIRSS